MWGLFVLILVGSVAILGEFFIPAFGIIGIAGLTTVVSAVVMGFSGHPEPWGTLLLLTALIITPTVVIGGFRRFPKSFFGKRMILATDQATAPGEGDIDVAVGATGTAITALHPGGTAEVAGRRVSVVTAGEFVESGTSVEVVAVEGARIVVRRLNHGV
ncbi:MAG: NfeD family protein [Alkalispirochaeta sp.]